MHFSVLLWLSVKNPLANLKGILGKSLLIFSFFLFLFNFLFFLKRCRCFFAHHISMYTHHVSSLILPFPVNSHSFIYFAVASFLFSHYYFLLPSAEVFFLVFFCLLVVFSHFCCRLFQRVFQVFTRLFFNVVKQSC